MKSFPYRRGTSQLSAGGHSFVRFAAVGFLATVSVLYAWGPSVFASAAANEPAASVALLLPSRGDPRWQQAAMVFENRLRQLDPNVNVAAFIAQGAESNQMQQAKQAIKDGANVLVVAPVNPGKAGKIVALSRPKKVAVIALDAPVEAKNLSLFVGFDPAAVGVLQGRYINSHARQGSRLVVLNGPANDQVAVGQYQGFDKTLKRRLRSHQLQLAGKPYWTPFWSSSEAEQDMVDALFRNGDKVQGVIAANDTLAAGARKAIRGAHLAKPPTVVGANASLSALRALLAGTQNMTVYKPIVREAHAAAAATFSSIAHTKLPSGFDKEYKMKAGSVRAEIIQPEVVTASNLTETVLKDHFVSRAKLCKGIRILCRKHHV